MPKGSITTTSSRDVRTCALLAIGVVLVYGICTWSAFSAVERSGSTLDSYIAGASDSQEYVALAHTMLSVHRFAMTPEALPEVFRTPVYPAFIAVTLLLFGSLTAVVALQIALMALTVVLIYLIGARHFSRGVGLFAAIVFALDPSVMLLASAALSETLFNFLFLLAVWLIGNAEGKRRIALLTAGILLGVAALERPVGLYLIPFIALFAALYPRQGVRRAIVAACIVLAAAAVVIAPWIVRNGLLGGGWGVSSITGYNALFYNAEQFQAYKLSTSTEALTARYDMQLGTTSEEALRSFPYSDREKQTAESIIVPQLTRYALFHIAKTAPFFLSSSLKQVEESSDFPFPSLVRATSTPVNISSLVLSGNVHSALAALAADPLALIERFFWLIVTVLAFCYPFALLIVRSPKWRVAFSWWLIVGAFAILTGPVSAARYRVPAEPFLLMLAAAAFAGILAWICSRTHSYEPT